MALILPPKSRKMHLREYAFSKFPGGECPRTPLGIVCQRHARVGLQPKYPPIIARFRLLKTLATTLTMSYKMTDNDVCRASPLDVTLGSWY